MKKVFNSTEGGARIKGTTPIPLCDYIKEYCQETIDKSKLKPLLTYADNGDELVEKVIPLLQDDIDNLDTIIKSSRIAMAANIGMANLIERKKYQKLMKKKTEKLFNKIIAEAKAECEARQDFTLFNHLFYENLLKGIKKPELKHFIKLSQINYHHSTQAHQGAIRNPLVNVAIYGASRQIQGRELKAESGLIDFLKDIEIAKIRIKRNSLILKTAKKASESLRKSYKETLNLLEEYNDTKNDELLRPIIKEEINLDDAESYFETGNWAHPLIDSDKIMLTDKCLNLKTYNKALEIYSKAINLRQEAIQQARLNEKENLPYERKLLKYNQLIEEAKEIGKKGKDFEEATKLLKEATELLPEEIEGRWGYATALHHSKKLDEAIIEYQKLTDDFPDNAGFKFEFGQVLLVNNKTQEGLKEIGKAMEMTDEYDHFLVRVGEIYQESKMYDEALIAYENYLEKFPHDYKAWYNKSTCLGALNKNDEANKAQKKALEINPNLFKK